MAKRARWFRASWTGGDLEALAKRVALEPFKETRGWGFAVSSIGAKETAGAYFEKVDRHDVVLDPFGREREVAWTEYKKVEFVLRAGFPHIEISAGRSPKPLFDRLAEFLSFKVVLEPVRVDVARWLALIEGSVGAVTVTGVRATDVALSNDAAATLVVEGTSDVRLHLKTLLHGRDSTWSKIEFWWPRTREAACELSADGAASLDERIPKRGLDVVRRALSVVET